MGDGSVNAKIGVERKKLLKERAESLGQSITAVVITAVDAFLSEEKKSMENIPSHITNHINYLKLLVDNGDKKDWALLKEEVLTLWKLLNKA